MSMKTEINQLQPTAFFTHFNAISQIPRGSGNEEAVSHYVADFARNLGYKVVQDKLFNLIIYKPAAPGYEEKPAVILQGHLDMVCEKNAGTVHDFATDALDLYIDGDYLRARGTTLGADNGTAVAICMAILEDKTLPHPALEMILTVEEETGMDGALALDAGLFAATRMINLDSSNENIITIGCAAGVIADFNVPAQWENAATDTAMRITVHGLVGGHSGGDIHKGRGNALVIMGCVLAALEKECGIQLTQLSGGMKVNAIPREAVAELTFPAENAPKVAACLAECNRAFRQMFSATEPGLTIVGENIPLPQRVLSADCTDRVIAALLLLPNGVQAMSQDMPGVVAASCNVGVAETTDDAVRIEAFPRGATADYLTGMEQQIRTLSERTGANLSFIQRSPAWAYNPASPLLKTTIEVFKSALKKDPIVTAFHAGLECGILAEKIPNLDIVSLGPDTHDLHTPDERLSISSLQREWAFLLELLAAL